MKSSHEGNTQVTGTINKHMAPVIFIAFQGIFQRSTKLALGFKLKLADEDLTSSPGLVQRNRCCSEKEAEGWILITCIQVERCHGLGLQSQVFNYCIFLPVFQQIQTAENRENTCSAT